LPLPYGYGYGCGPTRVELWLACFSDVDYFAVQ